MPAESYTDRTKIDDYPWRQLDPATVEVLRPVLDDTAEEMIQAVVSSVPAYARPIEGEFGVGIVAGVQAALSHLMAEIEESGPVGRPDVYRALGQGEMRAGRSMDSLLTAYRIGARVAWRRFAAAGVEAGLDPDTLYFLAEGIFAYIDVLSSESAEGHAAEQSAAAGEAELRRRRLVRVLVREPPADAAAVRAAATSAEWALPRSLAVLAIAGDARARAASRLPVGSISEDLGEITCAVVTDPDGPGRRAEIERAVDDAGATAGLGTTVEWGRAALSFQRARAALALALADRSRGCCPRGRTPAACCSAPTRGSPRSWPPRCSPRSMSSHRARGRVCDRRCARGWRSRDVSHRSPSGWACTRRQRATGSVGCVSCSARTSPTPTGVSGSSSPCARRPRTRMSCPPHLSRAGAARGSPARRRRRPARG